MNDSSHIISIEESQWSPDTTFLLTPLIQYNKFEAIEEVIIINVAGSFLISSRGSFGFFEGISNCL
jgi:hypothetical protein